MVVKARRGYLALAAVLLLLAIGAWLALAPRPDEPPAAFANPPAPARLADLATGGESGLFYPATAEIEPVDAGAWRVANQGCGTSGCHAEIAAEWEASPHRFSGLENPWYRAAHGLAVEELGAATVRWCAGCHSPALLLSQTEISSPDPGVDCLSCHAMRRASSSLGQGDYEIAFPGVEAWAVSENAVLRRLHRLRARVAPGAHAAAYRAAAWAGPHAAEACSTCHRAQLEEAVGSDRHRPWFDDHGPWAASASGRRPSTARHDADPASCVDCHMPSGPTGDGEVRSHRFAAGHTALAAWREDPEQLARIEDFLRRSEVGLDLFARTEEGALGAPYEPPPVDQAERVQAPLDRLPRVLQRGRSSRFDLVVRARGSGHRLPGGKGELGQVWLEVRAVDDRGRVLFESGRVEPGEALGSEVRRFDPLFVLADGGSHRGERPWVVRGLLHDPRLDPDAPQRVRFRLDVPAAAGDQVTVTAALEYRALDPAFNTWAFDRLGAVAPELPITTLARTAMTFSVVEPAAAPTAAPEPVGSDAERWYDYGLALADLGDHAGSREAFSRAIELAPEHARAHLERALVVPGLEEPRALLDRALDLDPTLVRARHFRALLQRVEGDHDQALATFEALAAAHPLDPEIQRELGHTLFTLGRFDDALEAYRAVVAIEPFDVEAHRSLSRVHRALGDGERAAHHQTLVDRLGDDTRPPAPSEPARGFDPRAELEPVPAARGEGP